VKRTFVIIHLVLVSFFASGVNRIATVSDQQVYGNYITPGDLIIDTPTKVTGENSELIYYFMQKQWPQLREGATLWLDGEKLGILKVIKFCNTADALAPWHIQSATVKNIPHTKVITTAFFCQGLKHFTLDGESSSYPGLSAWPASRKFLTGSFGFHVIGKLLGGHGYHITVLHGGTIVLKGFEAQHGFSGVRINGGDYDITVESIEITNFYIHDTGDGEGLYLGATHAPPVAKLKNLHVHQGIITRTAAEALQFQHLTGGANIHNITIRNADVRWMNEFRDGQDTGIQWSIDAGENKLHHVLLDGFASVALVPFGSDQKPTGGVSEVSHVLFNDGIDTGIYLHKSGSYGIHWIFENLYFRGFSNNDYGNTGRTERKFIVSAKNGTDQYTFKKIFHDGSKANVFQNTNGIEVAQVEQQNLPAPEYMNCGFNEPASKIKQWHKTYAGYFPASKAGKVKISTAWEAGNIAIETNGEYAFYKCIKAHKSDGISPARSSNFIKLTWDEHGVRSDQPGWQATTLQSSLPPDDLRLKKDNYWKLKEIGFLEY
jgi:hypothetical protein